ncbi:16S rRNA (guanine(966)-N(2))-methyltransferase RsmD [Gemella cuniculi]|uniref:16S rRNA (guanine(966)-N(2))-methyltransferase RsmD n=1 Tax=Gemella cuniculi TaxID=150240 RepID=UPI0004115385|nr:16S rRNA (guanine(966)-N(2))-methyltransferase RsmD [Gemella cuniculi]
MRVIAGKYKSIKLNAVDGMNTRPTTDKIKENLFNMLECMDAKVLDLFGGTGGLGIESLSRDAKHVTFIDGSSNSIKVIYSNLEKCKIPKSDYVVYRNDFKRAVKILGKKEEKFDLIFLDPPYNKDLIDKALDVILFSEICSDECLIVCEKSNDENITIKSEKLEIIKEKKYGITDIVIFKYMEK